jgi:ribosomal protein S18 acetylase RimI-like enzyme
MQVLLQRAVKVATSTDRRQAIDAITLAFEADPAARWMYPDAEQYRRFWPDFVEGLGGRAFECRAAYSLDDGSAAALWLPPGTGPDEALLGAVLEESVHEREKRDAFAVFEQMAHAHPDEPHWYLPLIGVPPALQGRGYGSALMEHALRLCDRDGTPAYLEATSLKSVPLYRRHGFEIVGVIQVGASPPIFPMVRSARSAWPR